MDGGKCMGRHRRRKHLRVVASSEESMADATDRRRTHRSLLGQAPVRACREVGCERPAVACATLDHTDRCFHTAFFLLFQT